MICPQNYLPVLRNTKKQQKTTNKNYLYGLAKTMEVIFLKKAGKLPFHERRLCGGNFPVIYRKIRSMVWPKP